MLIHIGFKANYKFSLFLTGHKFRVPTQQSDIDNVLSIEQLIKIFKIFKIFRSYRKNILNRTIHKTDWRNAAFSIFHTAIVKTYF